MIRSVLSNERNPLLLLLYLNSAFISWLIFGVQFLPKDSIHYYVAFIGVFLAQLPALDCMLSRFN
jgi:hypothetical protein